MPEKWRPIPADTALTLLIGGRISKWEGPRGTVKSAVCAREADGTLRQIDLGPVALASAAEGMQAVQAAAQAWAGGRGDWPRASVETRIRCTQDFLARMR